MKKLIIGLLVGGLAGAIAGFAAGIFIYPFWFLNEAATEVLPDGVARTALAKGTFIHVKPSDPVHWGKGGVTVYREESGSALVHLGGDFEVGPGPRYHVYLVDGATIGGEAVFKAAQSVDLGRLRAFRGSQSYAVPLGTDPARYRSVVVWCKELNVLITAASLGPPKPG